MNISDEAVEAAADALEKADGLMYHRSMYQRMAIIALEAAAPHMLNGGWVIRARVPTQ